MHLRPADLAAELPAVLELMTTSLGPGPTRTPAFVRWKHLQNPFGTSFVWVAEDAGELVALRTMMRWDFTSHGRTVKAVRAVDTATRPSHRRQGLFRRLTMGMVESLGAEGIELIFNTPNDQSRPGYLKMGWHEVGRPWIFVSPRLGRAPRTPSVAVHPVTLDDPRLHTQRTHAYLRWRYRDYERVDDKSCQVVWRERTRDGREEMLITDVLIPEREAIPDAARLLRRARAQAQGAYALAVATPRSREAIALVLAGFVPVPGQGPGLVVRRVPGQSMPACEDLRDWRLQAGDLELF